MMADNELYRKELRLAIMKIIEDSDREESIMKKKTNERPLKVKQLEDNIFVITCPNMGETA